MVLRDMSPISNPFAPGAGTPPPELVGRDEVREKVRVALERTRRGIPTKSVASNGLEEPCGLKFPLDYRCELQQGRY